MKSSALAATAAATTSARDALGRAYAMFSATLPAVENGTGESSVRKWIQTQEELDELKFESIRRSRTFGVQEIHLNSRHLRQAQEAIDRYKKQ